GAGAPQLGLWRFGGACQRAFPWMEDWAINDIGFSADGRFLAAALANREMGLVDLETEPPPHGVLYHSDNAVRVAWSPVAPVGAGWRAGGARGSWCGTSIEGQSTRASGRPEGLSEYPQGEWKRCSVMSCFRRARTSMPPNGPCAKCCGSIRATPRRSAI